jgi:hypothetical protein
MRSAADCPEPFALFKPWRDATFPGREYSLRDLLDLVTEGSE